MRRGLLTRKIFLLVCILACIGPPQARAARIEVLQSARLPAYDSALQGFAAIIDQDTPARGQKAIQAHTLTTHILSESANAVLLRQQIIDERPDLVLVIGSSSLSLVKDLQDIPILYLMVPFPETLVQHQDNITGINLQISAAEQLAALTAAAPEARRIGLVYDPARTGALVDEARAYAAGKGLALIAQAVSKADEVPGQLASLKGRIDWLWMVPDLTVLTPQTVDYILLFSLENRVPVLTFADKYLDLGAVLAVAFDPSGLGRQAGALALKLLRGEKIADHPPEMARAVHVQQNPKAARMIGVTLREAVETK